MRNFIEIDNDGILLCPSCGGNYLHHGLVADMVNIDDCVNSTNIATIIGGEKSTKSYSDVKLPFRGDSIAISFWCENCEPENNKKYLYISQHKGNSHITWENEFPKQPTIIDL
ncbi:MAG: hypothetical protein ACXVH2_00775 [Methanobacterium sp.]